MRYSRAVIVLVIQSCDRQGPVVELLSQWKAGTDPDQVAAELRAAASRWVTVDVHRTLSSVPPATPDQLMMF